MQVNVLWLALPLIVLFGGSVYKKYREKMLFEQTLVGGMSNRNTSISFQRLAAELHEDKYGEKTNPSWFMTHEAVRGTASGWCFVRAPNGKKFFVHVKNLNVYKGLVGDRDQRIEIIASAETGNILLDSKFAKKLGVGLNFEPADSCVLDFPASRVG